MDQRDEPRREPRAGSDARQAVPGAESAASSRPRGDARRNRKARLEREIKMERRAVLLVNSRSRRGKQCYSEAKRLLERAGIALDPRYSSVGVTRLSRLVPEAIANGHRLIIVAGGDGTLTSVLRHFAYRDVVLGILPLGTANSFARTLGIPLDLAAAVDVLVSGKVVDVDLGRIGEHYFSTVASVGLASRIARRMPWRLKQWFGRLAYVLVAIAELRRLGAFRCTVRANGRQTTLDAVEVRVANGGYQAGVLVAHEASAESLDLVVQITRGRSVRELLKVWLRLAAGGRPDPENVETLRSDRFEIDADPRQYVCVDGEAFVRTPFEASVARQALLVTVPRDEHDLE